MMNGMEMNGTDKLLDEPARLAALERYDVLDAEPEAEFDSITALVKSVFDVPMVAVSLVAGNRQWFMSRQGVAVRETPREVSFCQHTIRGRGVLAVEDATQDRRFADNPLVTGAPGIRSYLGAPLRTPEGYNVGTLCIIDVKPRRFGATEAAMLRNFASLIVSQLELRQIASCDALTGALSRRAFEEVLRKELGRHQRYGTPVTLAVFDLDHFKKVNDTYGHPAGDAVLRATVAACMENMRESDSLGRYGGEEFCVLFAGASQGETVAALERLRHAIEAARAPEHPHIAFTASFGAAACRADFKTTESWHAAADACLYRAKREGRNRCVVETAGPH